MRLALALATTCAVAAMSPLAFAEANLVTQVSATQVEVGQRFSIQVTCDFDGDAPTDPRLPVPRGIAVDGPSISSQQSISIVNGRMERKTGLVATWVLSASSVGKYRIGPASMVVDGRRLVDRPVSIEVVNAGPRSNPGRARRRGLPFDPFDPFGGSDPFSGPMFPPMPGLNIDPGGLLDEAPPHPPELDIDKAKDPTAFLDARATPKRVVLGEQIRLSVYIYNRQGVDPVGLSEPNLDGFLSYRSEHDDLLAKTYAVRIGEDRWLARKVLSYALFPTKTGTLTIGPTVMPFASRTRLTAGGGDTFERKSEPIAIIVEEPPLASRPASYHLGDVGQFQLSATVEPRQLNAGDAVSVQVEVKGIGQLPQRLDPPEQASVDWLEPSVSQQLSEQRERIGGSRQFSYVVRINKVGLVDLGEMKLAYFDPTTRKYAIAKAKLGTVDVKANAAPQASASAGAVAQAPGATDPSLTDPLVAALAPRGKLTSEVTWSKPLSERPLFFYWLGIGPITLSLFFVLRRGIVQISTLRNKRKSSAKAQIDAELLQAQRALSCADFSVVPGAIERAVHRVIEARTGLRSRGLLRSELATKLTDTGINDNVAQQMVNLLERCDNQRFVQTDQQALSDLLHDAKACVTAAFATTKRTGARQ